MAIEVFALDDINLKRRLFSLTTGEASVIEAINCHYQSKTGTAIDIYGKFRLYPDNIKLLLLLIQGQLNKVEVQNRRDLNSLSKKLGTLVEGCILFGD